MAGKIIGIVIAAIVVLGGLATAALFLFGKPVLDETKVQAEIVRITRDASGLEPTDVRCPANVPIGRGHSSGRPVPSPPGLRRPGVRFAGSPDPVKRMLAL